MKRAIVPLAAGFEEIEAVTVIDILRRVGVEVVVAGIGGDAITGSHGITVSCDARVEAVDPAGADAIVLPGGMPGARNLGESGAVRALVTEMAAAGKLVAAVCAAPTVLAACGVTDGRRATSHPAHAAEMGACRYDEAAVVEDGNVITSRGAGTTIEFAAAIAARLAGAEAAREVLERIQFRATRAS
jgi:4-methyl-5(b-hydroxyethyl)-thiazole monophosphate biosynthesis